MSDRVLIVGLGNPGVRYAATRHNVGYLVVDRVAAQLGVGFTAAHSLYQGVRCRYHGRDLSLMKPLTYMNRSGAAVRAWLAEKRSESLAVAVEGDAASPGEPGILVVCDDLHLPLGTVRLRASGGSGGQNGLADIIASLGHENFPRLRLGIAPLAGVPEPEDWADFVLTGFAEEEKQAVEEMVAHAGQAALAWAEYGTEYAASRFNRRGHPTGED